MKNLREIVKEKILILDGAMGTIEAELWKQDVNEYAIYQETGGRLYAISYFRIKRDD